MDSCLLVLIEDDKGALELFLGCFAFRSCELLLSLEMSVLLD